MNTFTNATLGSLLTFIGLVLLFFLAVRRLNLWYWKIDAAISSMKKQEVLLQLILFQLGSKGGKIRIKNTRDNIAADMSIEGALDLLSNNNHFIIEGFAPEKPEFK